MLSYEVICVCNVAAQLVGIKVLFKFIKFVIQGDGLIRDSLNFLEGQAYVLVLIIQVDSKVCKDELF